MCILFHMLSQAYITLIKLHWWHPLPANELSTSPWLLSSQWWVVPDEGDETSSTCDRQYWVLFQTFAFAESCVDNCRELQRQIAAKAALDCAS